MIDGAARVRSLQQDLMDLRYELLRNGVAHHDFFHASEDPYPVREAVFDRLKQHDFKQGPCKVANGRSDLGVHVVITLQ